MDFGKVYFGVLFALKNKISVRNLIGKMDFGLYHIISYVMFRSPEFH